jgi:hypothetical protein
MPHDVAAASLAELDEFWGDPATLSRSQRRWREFERELRANLAAQGGQVPEAGDPTIEEIRSGAWEKRHRQNMQNLLRDRAKLAQWRREGYTFDSEHGLVAPPRIHVREPVARPRERRAPTRRSAPSRGSPDDDPEPGRAGLPLEVRSLSRFRRDVDAWLGTP